MKQDHFLFFITLFLIFICPRFPVGQFIPLFPEKSAISLGLLGFIFWAILRPKYLVSLPNRLSTSLLWLFFALYVLLISSISFKGSSVIYGLQFFAYSYFGVYLIGNYLWRAKLNHQLTVVFGIIVVTGFIYGLGSLISVFTGPIYPHQVIAYARFWEGKWLQQGIGFGTNQNGVGGLLLFFISVAWFCWKNTSFKKTMVIILLCSAIVSTISRSALVSFVVATICILFIFSLALTLKQKINAKKLGIWLVLSIFVLIAFMGIPVDNNDYWNWMVSEGFGKGDMNQILDGESSRISAWQKGINVWAESDPFYLLLGQGMKVSSVSLDVAWISAHNLYISFLGDFGILGLVIFLFVILFHLIRSIGLSLRGNRVGFFALFFLTGLLFHNITECYLYGTDYVVVLLITFHIMNLECNRAVKSKKIN